jgi:hypothetical protein
MRYSPIFLVTDYRNVKRRSPASIYSETSEKLDLWKVGMVHGYYAGMGMDFYFENEGEASRFSPFTIYDPSQLIERMENRKFTVSLVKKTMRMGARNPYSGLRFPMDFWMVEFDGQNDDQIVLYDPSESTVRAFGFGKTYTMADLVGTLPAIPRDVSRLLEEYAIRAQEAREEAERERARKEAEEAAGREPPPTDPGTPPPTDPGTPNTPTGPSQLVIRQNAAVAQWWNIALGGKAGYYAPVNVLLYVQGTTFANTDQRGNYTFFSSGSFTRGSMPLIWGAPTTIPGNSLYNFQWFGFYVEP